MEPELPGHFDVVVVGTGLTESLVAAAAARAGKTVLHLDANPFYGARNATLSLDALSKWLDGTATGEPKAAQFSKEAGPIQQHNVRITSSLSHRAKPCGPTAR